MESKDQRWVPPLLYILLVSILSMAGYILYDLESTRRSLLNSFMLRPMESIAHHLEGFFNPVTHLSDMALSHAHQGLYDLRDTASVNRYFMPLLQHYGSITSIGVADTTGYEYDILYTDAEWRMRTVRPDATGGHNHWGRWNNKMDTCYGTWTESMREDPRKRPWYTGAMAMNGGHHWTGPYMFNTDSVYGITLSTALPIGNGMGIVAFDITLQHLSQFISQVRIGQRGGTFLLTRDLEPISLLNHEDEKMASAVSVITDRIDQEFTNAYEPIDMNVSIAGEPWTARVMRFELDNANHLFAVVTIPEEEMMAEVNRSTRIIYLGMTLTALFTGMLLFLLQRLRTVNEKVRVSAQKIIQQNTLISQHNREVQQSLDYAQRIQAIMLPQLDDLAKETMQQVMMLYLPKDTLSGDFYWGRHRKHISYFAVADCTGHGVPGAMMSVLGMDLLNAKVGVDPSALPENLLYLLRKMLISRMRSGDTIAHDGMDIGLCRLDHTLHTLNFAGAFTPLVLIRSKASGDHLAVTTDGRQHELSPMASSDSHHLYMIKGDRMPLGFVDYHLTGPFSGHQIKLQPKDSVYMMSDGFADQFGGPDNRKFGQSRLRNTLLELEQLPIDQRKDRLHSIIQQYMGHQDQIDDICIMGFIFNAHG